MRTADRLTTEAIRRSGPAAGVLVAVSLVGAGLELALPFVLGRAVDTFSLTWVISAGAVVVLLVVCDGLGVYASGTGGARAAAWLRHRALSHLLGVGPGVTRRIPAGDLVTRLGVNAEEAGRAGDAVVASVALVVPSAGALVLLVLIDPWLALTLAGGLVVIVFVLTRFLKTSTTIAGRYQEAQADIAARLVEAVAGARTIAAAGTAERETRRVLTALPVVRGHAMALWRANADAGVRAAIVVPLLEVLVLAVGGWRLSAGELTVGELYAAARYVVIGAGLGPAIGSLGRLARARAAGARLAEILDECPVAHGVRELPPGPGTLTFRDIWPDDLEIQGGTSVAVVGSGASRFARLAARLDDPAVGDVLLDGVPLRSLTRRSLRSAIGYAVAKPHLIGDTVAEATGDSREAAVAAGADDFIRRLPHGYRTPPAEAPMSGGERQRLGLTRAFAKGNRLLVLDDATSSLDTITERRVGTALAADTRTQVMVTHRAAVAARADRVIWLDQGRVRGFDRHLALWRDPDYRAVFQGGEAQ
ncbi:ABC transporter transmembrane domain-containing protein [Herbidospora mongoliensis]|uniref:ABC transporter transmembrane domain-containing protein n=1 Tax=Herbidospora mongoliensis TaxID=688067 RepID=UPI00082F36C3|nr:ABC transporter ATP-binding protein [Herbidospora mongoliensis]